MSRKSNIILKVILLQISCSLVEHDADIINDDYPICDELSIKQR